MMGPALPLACGVAVGEYIFIGWTLGARALGMDTEVTAGGIAIAVFKAINKGEPIFEKACFSGVWAP